MLLRKRNQNLRSKSLHFLSLIFLKELYDVSCPMTILFQTKNLPMVCEKLYVVHSMIKRVSELGKRETACVYKIDREDALGIRLLELGFTPGTPIQFVRRAPQRGFVEIIVRGSRFALGLAEAQSIMVYS